ncbi:MAG TPA: hypothetical protein VNA25_17905 [Phycisphaerae bacterium]|nr:hypothetical protein [Phycisphaerae bacterium]
MNTKGTRDLPARLEGLRRRFDRWRRTRKVRSRIPEPLWVSAVKVAGTYGIHRTAKALRVDYYALKKRVEQTHDATTGKVPAGTRAITAGKVPAERRAVTASKTPAGVAGATFLELPAPVWSGCGECTLELENAGGAKMRVHLKGVEAPDLAALARSFWQVES